VTFGLAFLAAFVIAAGLAPFAGLRADRTKERSPAAAQNERITALDGAAIYVLFIAVAITVVRIGEPLSWHYLVGFLLIPPTALKVWTTGSRFAQYYGGSATFRQAGPPPLFLRFVVAPVLLASTVVVFATGLELWAFGLAFGGGWRTAHALSAVVLILSAAAHVIGHGRRSAAAAVEEASGPTHAAITPRSIVVGSLLLGLALALASLLYVTPFPSVSFGG